MASVNGPPSWLVKGWMTIFPDMASTCGENQRTDARQMTSSDGQWAGNPHGPRWGPTSSRSPDRQRFVGAWPCMAGPSSGPFQLSGQASRFVWKKSENDTGHACGWQINCDKKFVLFYFPLPFFFIPRNNPPRPIYDSTEAWVEMNSGNTIRLVYSVLLESTICHIPGSWPWLSLHGRGSSLMAE